MVYAFAFIIASVDLSLFGYTGLSYLIIMASIGIYWLWRAIAGFETKADEKWARGMFGFSLIVLLVFSLMISLDSFLP